MNLFEEFLAELDRRWEPAGPNPIRLPVIGSAALMLQTAYVRGTKDGDILETRQINAQVKARLLELGGKGTQLHERFKIYLDVVLEALPFLPQTPLFHPVPRLGRLKHFEVDVLDVVDVVVSKLKRFNVNDDMDAREMIARGLVSHARLIKRFEEAVDFVSVDARARDLPRVVKNLHRIEREYFGLAASTIELPDWI